MEASASRFSCAYSVLMTCAPGFRRSVSGGGLNKKPTARFASGGGLETFSSLLAVSPRAGSENSLLRLSRGNRHRRRSGNSLRRDGNHTGKKSSTRKTGRIAKIENENLDKVQKIQR